MQILLILFSIFWINSAQSAACDYSLQYFWTTGYINYNSSYYSCYLETGNDDLVSKIQGQHGSGQSNDDVTYFFIIEGNSISTFTSMFCQTFKNLEVVRTLNANIRSLDGNSLKNCEKLNILDIAGTKVEHMPEDLLARNSKLTQIWFRDNQVSTLPEKLFLSQNRLKVLNLEGNQIRLLPAGIFHPLIELEALYLPHNKLQSLNPEWFEALQNLRWLFLNDNQIEAVPVYSFKSLSYLTDLYLYKNNIKSLSPNSFAGLHSLKILNLYGNKISDLPQNVLSPLTNLQELSLFDNNLTVVHAASFNTHMKLADIYLGSNRINQIDEKLLDKTAVTSINMQDNICNREQLRGIRNIKAGLKTCFENFKPKTQESWTLDVRLDHHHFCGKPTRGIGNIVGGQHVARDDFPWIAALITSSGKYFCGGTLVTGQKVVTAAHCIQDKHQSYPKLAGEVVIQIGVHDLSKSVEVGRVSHAVQSIKIHPDWNPLTVPFDADIAVLVLDRQAAFSEFIQPICLRSAQIAARSGVVVGYGKSEDTTKVHENIPKMIQTPIHSNEHCFLENSNLVNSQANELSVEAQAEALESAEVTAEEDCSLLTAVLTIFVELSHHRSLVDLMDVMLTLIRSLLMSPSMSTGLMECQLIDLNESMA